MCSQKCRSIADEFDAKTPPGMPLEMPLKFRSIVFKQILGVRDEATEMDRWCPN